MKLIIGNKNYSSWSLRPWILLKHAGADFEEVHVPLFTEAGEKLLADCPNRQVPVLHDGPLVLWDSLAICEYIADKYPRKALWPADAERRAQARSVSAEMHAGFGAMRTFMPMNCRRQVPGFEPELDTRIDINRIVQLLEDALEDSGGPWLFGQYSVADAMYAPVASRFRTYGIGTPAATRLYFESVLSDPAMQSWYRAATQENEVIEQAEIS